ncbi:protein phosphatase, partial [Streptomyces sp. NPDC059466]
MSQMPQPTALSRCPSCEEPLEAGDRFCGACGFDLSAVPAPPEDHPTITMNGTPARPPSAVAPVDWPVAPEPTSSGTPVHRAADIQGTDSGGSELPHGHDHVPGHAPGHAPGHGQPEAAGPQPPEVRPPGAGAHLPGAQPGGTPPSGVQPSGPHPAAAQPAGAQPSGVHPAAAHPAAAQPSGAQPSGAQPAGVRFDRPPEPDEYPLAPPAGAPSGPVADPRTADLGTPPAGTKLCVACRSGHVDSDGYCENCGHAQPRERDHMEQELTAGAGGGARRGGRPAPRD